MGSLFVNSNGKMLREQILLLFFTVLSSLLLCSCAFCDGEVKTTFPRGFSVSGRSQDSGLGEIISYLMLGNLLFTDVLCIFLLNNMDFGGKSINKSQRNCF